MLSGSFRHSDEKSFQKGRASPSCVASEIAEIREIRSFDNIKDFRVLSPHIC